MNLGDPELELVDPTPNVHLLFLHFDKIFFWTKLASRAVVRWSKRMYSCAGVCSYDRGGLCDIALSEPLLKLRPRKDLVETLLHEMIHAYLFITNRDRERDGHGVYFQAHMHRINKSAGLNISIYHDFHDEVELYQTHWWRCNGPCQTRKPYFGIVRRSQNRAPGPKDYWWAKHKNTCGGNYVKIKEPEAKQPEAKQPKPTNQKIGPTINDILKYLNNNNNKTVNKNINNNLPKNDRKPLIPIQKKATSTPAANTNTIMPVLNKGVVCSPSHTPGPLPFCGNGLTIDGSRKRSNSADVAETVRDIWAKKFADTSRKTPANNNVKKNNGSKSIGNSGSPPMKIQKIDDFFKNTTKSVLKDIYGQDFEITKSKHDNKLKAVPVKLNLVDCPICSAKINSNEINRHLDECLNKDIIKKLNQSNSQNSISSVICNKTEKLISASPIPTFKVKAEDNIPEVVNAPKNAISNSNVIDLTNINFKDISVIKKEPNIKEEKIDLTFDPVGKDEVKSVVKIGQFDKQVRKSDDSNDANFKFLNDMVADIKVPPVSIEPGTSRDTATSFKVQKCPCCGNMVDKSIAEHLDECLSFFDNNSTIPEEGASTSFANDSTATDDIFDETLTMNATGTKTPCPCCMKMIEIDDMNTHLDVCLS